MTLLREDYAAEILGGLRAAHHVVTHVTLHATHDALRDRIVNDTDDPGARTWRLEHAARYAEAADRLASLGPRIDTDGLTAREVAERVARTIDRARSAQP